MQAPHQHRPVQRPLRHRLLLVVRAGADADGHHDLPAQGRAGLFSGLRPGEEPFEAGDVRGAVRVHHERVPPARVQHALHVKEVEDTGG